MIKANERASPAFDTRHSRRRVSRLALSLLVIACLAPAARCARIDTCGSVDERHSGCRWFDAFDASYTAVRMDAPFPDSLLNVPVHLTGEMSSQCDANCSYAVWCIREYTVAPCEPVDLGCGVRRPYDCIDATLTEWVSLSTTMTLVVEPTGYAFGDTVGVTAIVTVLCGGICSSPYCLVVEATYRDCSRGPAKRASWGPLKRTYR
jgi:hypothetical protein